jgi:pimeloyl-ACP methyl ester carboxylesterase
MSAAPPAWLDRAAYPFDGHWLELGPGKRMHYVDEGNGPVLLFVHGTPTWSFEWRHLIRALSSSYRCIAPDLLGMGLSDRPRDFAYTPESHAEALSSFVSKLGLASFTLIAHDFGGPIGLPLALDSKRVDRLVLLNTWAWSFEGDADMEKKARMAGSAFGRFLYRWANASLRLIVPSAYADRRKLTPQIHRQYLEVFKDRGARVQVLWSFARSLLGSSGYYASLEARLRQLRQTPTLIVWGVKDTAFLPYQLERWRRVLPHARVVELPVGHWPHEESPADVIRAVSEFLAATDAAA